MSKPEKYTYRVSGRGKFPFDMLRYDQCWPRRERDSALIDAHTRHPNVEWEVELMGTRMPTAARWRSYGWEVVQ